MVTDSIATQAQGALTAGQSQIETGPIPTWVEPCPFRLDFQTGKAGDVTWLLLDRQIHSELRQTHFHVALRLNTRQAVQNESLWRLEFEPRHQAVTLHWIKTHRGETHFDHTNLSSGRLVERHAASSLKQERMVMLLMLEDVRPGDVLEWCYTIEDQPLLLPEHCTAFFELPAGVPLGKFHFSVSFDSSRPMQWQSSLAEWEPIEDRESGGVRWTWTRENFPALVQEEKTPAWMSRHPWIQISDCPDWGTVAAAFAQAWNMDEADATARGLAPQAQEGSIGEKAEGAIDWVRNEFRHIGAEGNLDALAPERPGVVARRRYGNAKDLAYLLRQLLRQAGAPARLVLVNTEIRQGLAQLLPAPGLFDHVLVEYELEGRRRWIDATQKSRDIIDYGSGLALAGAEARLTAPPEDCIQSNDYELHESILLDTTESWSWLGVVVAARGSEAEALRQKLAEMGLERFEEERLRRCAGRFGQARRSGPLRFRDDPATNEFFLAEVFEIEGFLTVDAETKWFKLNLANDFTANLLKVPGNGSRRAPLALSHPCHVTHTIELHSVALPPAVPQQRSIDTDYMRFARCRKTLAGYWTMKLTLATLADAVPAEALEEHRKAIRKIEAESAWSVLLPPGDPRPRQRGDFAALPLSWNFASSTLTPSKPPSPGPLVLQPGGHSSASPTVALKNGFGLVLEDGPEKAPKPPPTSAPPPEAQFKRRKRVRRKREKKPSGAWQIAMACGLALTLILIVFFVAKYADRWAIFRRRPAPPPSPTSLLPNQ